MNKLSIVIPALNESENMPKVMSSIPVDQLGEQGWSTEVVVVDNASTDGTGEVAANLGAQVVYQPIRGYGNAYKAGFAAARGDVIATGDADCTYPFDALPQLLRTLVDGRIDFLSTNRLGIENREAMKPSHVFGNHVLTMTSRLLFRSPFRDSQSGMWVFRRDIWQRPRRPRRRHGVLPGDQARGVSEGLPLQRGADRVSDARWRRSSSTLAATG